MIRLKFIVFLLIVVSFSGCSVLNKNNKSGLQVITEGVESSIYLDDQLIEKAPFINREIKPGEYTLKIQPDDPAYITHETKVTLRPGSLTVVTWKLATRPELSGGVIYEMEPINSKSKAEVSFVTIPDGAIVALENSDKDFSPVIISDVNPGHNAFEISLPSYESQQHTINTVAGYRMLVSVKLAKISIDTPVKPATLTDKTNTQAIAQNEQIRGATTSAEQTDLVKIKKTNFFINEKEVLRVRSLPNAAGLELGFADVGSNYEYLDETENNWHKIKFEEETGWVSKSYAEVVKTDSQ